MKICKEFIQLQTKGVFVKEYYDNYTKGGHLPMFNQMIKDGKEKEFTVETRARWFEEEERKGCQIGLYKIVLNCKLVKQRLYLYNLEYTAALFCVDRWKIQSSYSAEHSTT